MLKKNIIPDDWKNSITILIKKKEESLLVKDTRPITLLNVISKIFLNFINDELIRNITENNLIPTSQTGFYPNRGASYSIKTLIEIIEDSNKKNKELNILNLDYQGAFDRVTYNVLIKIMKKMNFNENLIQIINELLKNNKTKFETFYGLTKEIEIKNGLRQGMPTSPILYLISQAPLFFAIEKIKGYEMGGFNFTACSFADDSNLITDNKNNLKKMIDLIEEYDKETGSKLSPTKCVFTSNRKNENFKLIYNQTEIPFIEKNISFKYLGYLINLELNWNDLNKFLESKIKNILKKIEKKFYLNSNSIILFINQVIISILDYRFNNVMFDKQFFKIINDLIFQTLSKTTKIRNKIGRNFYCVFRKLNNIQIQNIKTYLINFQRIISNDLPISKFLINKNYKNEENKKKEEKIFIYDAKNGIPPLEKILNSLELKIYKPKKIQIKQKFLNEIKDKKEIKIFTDGSLINDNDKIKKKSALFIPEEIEINFIPNCSNSSYGTEISAIEAALIITKNVEKVEIFTDSKSAIESIQNFDDYKISKKIKKEDRANLTRISKIIKERKIKPIFHHVFSHLDNENTKNFEIKIS